MKRLKTIQIQGREFVTGKTECPVCGHKFKFIMTKEALLFWEHYCGGCTTAVDELPAKGQIIREGLSWE